MAFGNDVFGENKIFFREEKPKQQFKINSIEDFSKLSGAEQKAAIEGIKSVWKPGMSDNDVISAAEKSVADYRNSVLQPVQQPGQVNVGGMDNPNAVRFSFLDWVRGQDQWKPNKLTAEQQKALTWRPDMDFREFASWLGQNYPQYREIYGTALDEALLQNGGDGQKAGEAAQRQLDNVFEPMYREANYYRLIGENQKLINDTVGWKAFSDKPMEERMQILDRLAAGKGIADTTETETEPEKEMPGATRGLSPTEEYLQQTGSIQSQIDALDEKIDELNAEYNNWRTTPEREKELDEEITSLMAQKAELEKQKNSERVNTASIFDDQYTANLYKERGYIPEYDEQINAYREAIEQGGTEREISEWQAKIDDLTAAKEKAMAEWEGSEERKDFLPLMERTEKERKSLQQIPGNVADVFKYALGKGLNTTTSNLMGALQYANDKTRGAQDAFLNFAYNLTPDFAKPKMSVEDYSTLTSNTLQTARDKLAKDYESWDEKSGNKKKAIADDVVNIARQHWSEMGWELYGNDEEKKIRDATQFVLDEFVEATGMQIGQQAPMLIASIFTGGAGDSLGKIATSGEYWLTFMGDFCGNLTQRYDEMKAGGRELTDLDVLFLAGGSLVNAYIEHGMGGDEAYRAGLTSVLGSVFGEIKEELAQGEVELIRDFLADVAQHRDTNVYLYSNDKDTQALINPSAAFETAWKTALQTLGMDISHAGTLGIIKKIANHEQISADEKKQLQDVTDKMLGQDPQTKFEDAVNGTEQETATNKNTVEEPIETLPEPAPKERPKEAQARENAEFEAQKAEAQEAHNREATYVPDGATDGAKHAGAVSTEDDSDYTGWHEKGGRHTGQYESQEEEYQGRHQKKAEQQEPQDSEAPYSELYRNSKRSELEAIIKLYGPGTMQRRLAERELQSRREADLDELDDNSLASYTNQEGITPQMREAAKSKLNQRRMNEAREIITRADGAALRAELEARKNGNGDPQYMYATDEMIADELKQREENYAGIQQRAEENFKRGTEASRTFIPGGKTTGEEQITQKESEQEKPAQETPAKEESEQEAPAQEEQTKEEPAQEEPAQEAAPEQDEETKDIPLDDVNAAIAVKYGGYQKSIDQLDPRLKNKSIEELQKIAQQKREERRAREEQENKAKEAQPAEGEETKTPAKVTVNTPEYMDQRALDQNKPGVPRAKKEEKQPQAGNETEYYDQRELDQNKPGVKKEQKAEDQSTRGETEYYDQRPLDQNKPGVPKAEQESQQQTGGNSETQEIYDQRALDQNKPGVPRGKPSDKTQPVGDISNAENYDQRQLDQNKPGVKKTATEEAPAIKQIADAENYDQRALDENKPGVPKAQTPATEPTTEPVVDTEEPEEPEQAETVTQPTTTTETEEKKTEEQQTEETRKTEEQRRIDEETEQYAKQHQFKFGPTQGDGSQDSGVHLVGTGRNIPENRMRELQIIDKVAKRFGFSVEVTPEMEHNANGKYEGGRTIHINQNTENAFETVAGHEMWHMVKRVSADSAKRIESIFDKYADRTGFDAEHEIDNIIASYARQGALDSLGRTDAERRAGAKEELIANSFYSFFGDRETMRQVYAADRGVFERVMDFVRKVQQSIQEMLKTYADNTPEARMLTQQNGALEEMYQAMRETLEGMQALDETKKAAASEHGNGTMTRKYEQSVKNATSKEQITDASRELARDVLKQTGNEVNESNIQHVINAAQDVASGTQAYYALRDNMLDPSKVSEDTRRGLRMLGGYYQHIMSTQDLDEWNALMMGRKKQAKYSLKYDRNGDPYVEVDVDQRLFDGLSESEARKKALKILQERFVNKTFELEQGPARLSNSGARETVRKKEYGNTEQKMLKLRASTEFDNIMKAAKYAGPEVQQHYHQGWLGVDGYDVNIRMGNIGADYHIVVANKADEREIHVVELAQKQSTQPNYAGGSTNTAISTDLSKSASEGSLAQQDQDVKQNVEKLNIDNEDGLQLTQELEGGTVAKYSLGSWRRTDIEKVRQELISAGFTRKQVDNWISNVNSIAALIAEDKSRLDYRAAENQQFLKDNAEYVKTLDSSTLCAKRRLYQGTFDAIQHELPNTVITSDMLIHLRNMMAERRYETPCGICYVESRRRNLGTFTERFLKDYEGDSTGYKPTMADLTTTDGLEDLRTEHPEAYEAYRAAMAKTGSNNPKVVQPRTEYRNEIRQLTPGQVQKILEIGGLRVQSFSDFETPHLIDMMQAVLDMSEKKLTSQAYTKVPNFAAVFGGTGIKINLSLIADGTGLDKNGNLVYSSYEGMDIKRALELRDQYPDDVGTILVGVSDEHIKAAMASDDIDFIIPFHKSGWGKKQLEQLTAMRGYHDYTADQNERRYVGQTKTGKPRLKKVEENFHPVDYWDYSKSGKENAQIYLDMCAKDGRIPKFARFLKNNGDGSYSLQPDGSTDGYWKLLGDFKMYNHKTGQGTPQRAVTPNFNMDEAQRVMNEYEGGADTLPVAQDVVRDFVKEYKSQHPRAKYSINDERAQAGMEEYDRQMEYTGGQTEALQKLTGDLWQALALRKQQEKAENYGQWKQHVAEMARELKEQTNSAVFSEKQLEERLTKILEEHERLPHKTKAEAQNALNTTLNELQGLIQEALSDQLMDEHYKDVKAALKNGIYISPEMMKEQGGAAEARDLRNAMTGFTRVYTNEQAANKAGALHLDGHGWDELQSIDPDLFNPDTHWLERAQALRDFVDLHSDSSMRLDPMTRDYIRTQALETLAEYYSGSNETDATKRTREALKKANSKVDSLNRQLTAEIKKQGELNEQIKNLKTQARDADSQAWQERSALTSERDRLKQELQAARDNALAIGQQLTEAHKETERLGNELNERDNREFYLQNTISLLKKQNKANQEAAVRDDRRRNKEKAKQRAEDVQNRKNIKNTLDKMKRMTANPSPTAYIPMDKIMPLQELLEAAQNADQRRIDRATEQWMKTVREMRDSENDWYTQNTFDKGLQEQMQEVCDILKERNINQLSGEDLRYVSNVFTETLHQIENATKMIDRKRNTDALMEAADAIETNKQQKGVSNNSFIRGAQKFTQEHLSPKRFLNMLSGYKDGAWNRIGTDLIEGQRKQERARQLMLDEIRGLTQGKENERKFDKFTGKNAELIDTGIKDKRGQTVKITQAQRVSFYLHALNDQNLRHFVYEVTLPDQQLLKQGKKTQAYDRSLGLRLIDPMKYKTMDERVAAAREAINKITAGMTEYEKQWVAAYQKLAVKSTNYINDTSRKLHGYEKAIVENYFPIKTDRDFLAQDFESLVRNGTIEGMGSLKARVNGTNPMVIEDVTDVINRMVNNTALYYGMAIPVRNFNKMYNGTLAGYEDSVKASLKRTWGTEGVQYLERLMNDIQGNGRSEERTFLDAFRSKYAGAVLTLNPSVMMKQAASLPTAAASLGWSPIMKALGSTKKVSADLINKYTSAYIERANGGIRDMEANAQRNTTAKKGLYKLGNGIQAVDLATIKKVWLAAEFHTQENHPNLKQGTDAYYEQVARTFETAVEDTQPEYGVMQRPHILRTQNQLVRALTVFKTQSIQNFNILYDATMNLRAKQAAYKADPSAANKTQLDQAKTSMARAASSQIVSAAVLAVMTALGKALLHKPEPYQDDKGEITAESATYQLSKDALSSMAGMLIGGNEIFDLIVGISEGKQPFDIEANSISLLNDIYQSTYKLGNAAGVIGDSSLTWEQKKEKLGKAILSFSKSTSAAYGVPLNNMLNIKDSIEKYVDDIINGRGLEGLTTGDVKLATAAKYMGEALQKGDKAAYTKLYNRLLKQGKSQKEINTALKSWMKTGDKRVQQAADAIENGDLDTYNRLINEMVKDGYGMANVVTTIETVRKAEAEGEQEPVAAAAPERMTYDEIMAAQKDEDADTYTYAQLNNLLENGNTHAARTVQSALFKTKGTTKVKSALTSYWKPKYKEAYQSRNRTELARITKLMKTMGYSDDSLKKWVTEKTTTPAAQTKTQQQSVFGNGVFGSGFGKKRSYRRSSGFGSGFGGKGFGG